VPAKRRMAMLRRTLVAVVRGPAPQPRPPFDAAHLPALRGRLELVRDANGVPHLYAAHEPDLFAALGYLQAIDRFPLLDLVRHLGAGRLCELVGNLGTPAGNEIFSGRRVSDLDGFIRPLGFEAQCERDYTRVSERGRDCLAAFAAGINAGLRAMRGVYPPEYLLLGPVRPWEPSDALLAARACAFCISLNPFDVELIFDAVRGRLGDAAARRFYPDAPWENVPGAEAVGAVPEPEAPLHLTAGGSNNWAIGAARTAAGGPIMANDPHVPLLPLPTFWYHAHLETPGYRVQGGLMLGCPVFGFGHNGAFAWGCTTAYRDGWDMYRIHRLRNDASRYRTVAGTGIITRHREWHAARFGREVVLEWESCEHGILYPGWRHHDGTDLAVRLVPSDLARYFDGYLALAESRTVDEHRRALALINDGPFDFNHVYAHKDGHIGWEPFGRLPRRAADGLFVRDAHDPKGEWEGFVPFEEMPKILNPACGYVASANSIVDAGTYRAATTAVHVEPRYRQRRIEEVLAASDRHTWESSAALQRDVAGDYAPPVRDALLGMLRSASAAREPYAAATAALAAWNGEFRCDAAGATVFVFVLQELARRVFEPLLGERVARRYLNGRRAVARLHRLLVDQADPLRPDVTGAARTSLEDLTRQALVAAVDRLAACYGDRPEDWQWGTVQRVRLATMLGELPLIGRFFETLDAPFPGEQYTVSPSASIPTAQGLRAFVGASSRFICDLARPGEAWFAHSSGPSGDIGSPFFANLSAPWYRFEYFRSALWKPDEVPNVVERVVVGL
jgi:penicillin amidase